MIEGEILRICILLAVVFLVLLFVGALTNKVTIYRDLHDFGWSVALVLSPVIGLFVLAFLAGGDSDFLTYVAESLMGKILLGITAIVFALAVVKTYIFSIQDNGTFLGALIGTGKICISVIITICAIGLVNYLFKDQRKLGHIAIFLMLSGIFTWAIKILVNGERVKNGQRENS